MFFPRSPSQERRPAAPRNSNENEHAAASVGAHRDRRTHFEHLSPHECNAGRSRSVSVGSEGRGSFVPRLTRVSSGSPERAQGWLVTRSVSATRWKGTRSARRRTYIRGRAWLSGRWPGNAKGPHFADGVDLCTQPNAGLSCETASEGSLLWRCPIRRVTSTAGLSTAPTGCWTASRSCLCLW